MLKIQTFGNKTHITDLLIVHGLFGSGRNWRAIARNISSDRQVHVVDMRNHGESFWNADNSYESMAEDLKKIITSLKSSVDVLGHSMGGKASMVLAINNPDLVNRLLIVDIAPTKYQAGSGSSYAPSWAAPAGSGSSSAPSWADPAGSGSSYVSSLPDPKSSLPSGVKV